MRYQNWDVVLVPADSLNPLKEFKIECYVTPDPGKDIPLVLTYYDFTDH